MIALPNNHSEGDRLKRLALKRLKRRRNFYVRRGCRAMIERLFVFGEATMDDVRAVVELPPGVDPKLFGAVASTLRSAGVVRSIGYTKTKRAVAHARMLNRWRLADPDAARRWLATHPVEADAEPAAVDPETVN
ncbi:MAG: hypothetical protein ACRDD1_03435 [Planctomycetia bacterium]